MTEGVIHDPFPLLTLDRVLSEDCVETLETVPAHSHRVSTRSLRFAARPAEGVNRVVLVS